MSTLSNTVRVKIDDTTKRKLERRARKLDRSVSAMIRIAIREHLERHAAS